MSIALNFHRKCALAIALVLFGGYALLQIPERPMDPFEALPQLLLIALVLFGLVVAAVVALFTRSEAGSTKLRWFDRLLPAITLVVSGVLVSFLDTAASRHHALAFAADHAEDLAGPAPQGVLYFEGIPDGGTAIIASPGRDPMTYPAKVRFRLTNGNMRSCRKLDEKLWLCAFG